MRDDRKNKWEIANDILKTINRDYNLELTLDIYTDEGERKRIEVHHDGHIIGDRWMGMSTGETMKALWLVEDILKIFVDIGESEVK